MATGDKRTGKKKYGLGGSRNYGQITDEMEQKCVDNKFQKILENSTDIRSESYWHQINHLILLWMVTKKYGLAVVAKNKRKTDKMEQKCLETFFTKF